MSDPLKDPSILPSQHRQYRMQFFPMTDEAATVEMPQPNGVKQQAERPISSEETVKLPPTDGMRRIGQKFLSAQDTVKMPPPDSERHPGEKPISSEDTLKMPLPDSAKEPGEKLLSVVKAPQQKEKVQPVNSKQTWKPGTFGFGSDTDDTDADDPDFDKLATIPLMVVRGIAKQQGAPQPVMKSEISEAAGSAAYVSIGNIGGSILKYGGNIVIQRGFGAAAFGLYTFSMSVMLLATAVFNLGLDDAMVRYVSIYRARRQSSSLHGLTIFCTAVVGGVGILGALLVLYFAPILAALRHSPEMIPILQLMSPIVPLLCLQTIWISGLQGFKEFKWRVLVQRILIPITLILLLLGCLVFFHNVNAIVIATVINAMIGTALSLFFYVRKAAGVMKPEPAAYELRNWLGFATPNFLTSIVDTVLESTDTILLAYFAISNTALGQYAAAIKISGFILMPQASFNAMFAPTIAELHSQGEKQKLAAMFKVVTKWVITFSLPIFGIATLFSRSLLSIGGEGFVSAWPLVIAFSVGTLVNVSTGAVGYMLLMTGHTKISFLNSLTAILVNVVVGCILAPRYGAMGVAVATGLSVCVVNLMRLFQVGLLVKMQPYRLDVLKPVGAALISAALIGSLLYLLNFAHLSIQIYHLHLPFDLSLVPVFLVSYIGLLAFFKVSPEDKIVLDMLRRKFRRSKKNKKR